MSSIPSNKSSNTVQLSDTPNIHHGFASMLQNESALKELDINSLLNLSALNSKWNHEVNVEPKGALWQKIADRIPEINLPRSKREKSINKDLHKVRERFSFVKSDLEGRFVGLGLVPPTPYNYLSTEKITELFRARDTLIVWEILADKIFSDVLNDANMDINISTYADIIRFTNQFDSWVEDNISTLNDIQELDLSDQDLTSLPPSIGKMFNIETLNLQGNYLTSLPSSIGELTNLEHLNLMENALTSLPEEIGNCSALRVLECNNNALSSLPASFIKLQELRRVYFLSNKFTSVPDCISCLENLKMLNLNYNRITSIPDRLEDLNLEELKLEDNPLEYIPEGLREFWPDGYQAPEATSPPLKRAKFEQK